MLTAANGPDRVAPQTPGGSDVPYQGFKVYEQPAAPDDNVDAASAPQVAQNTMAPAAAPKPVEQAITPPPAAKPVTAPKPVAKVAAPPVTATAAPRQLGTPVPVPAQAAPKPAPVAASPAAAAGAYVLQIGAYKSQAEADGAWKTYQAKHSALLSGFGPNVQQADLGEKGTWYRLRITGFAGKDGAVALCDRLKSDGGACFLGR